MSASRRFTTMIVGSREAKIDIPLTCVIFLVKRREAGRGLDPLHAASRRFTAHHPRSEAASRRFTALHEGRNAHRKPQSPGGPGGAGDGHEGTKIASKITKNTLKRIM